MAILTLSDRTHHEKGVFGGDYNGYEGKDEEEPLMSESLAWIINGTVICDAQDAQYNPQLTSDGSGGTIVTWMDYRSGSNFDIYAQRVDSAGIVRREVNG